MRDRSIFFQGKCRVFFAILSRTAGIWSSFWRVLIACCLVAFAPWLAMQEASAGEVGYNTVFSSSQLSVANTQHATRVTLAADTTINSISAYIYGDDEKGVRYAIYADAAGEPGALLGQTNSSSTPHETWAWKTIYLQNAVQLTAGDYWLAVSFEKSNDGYRYNSSGGDSRVRNYDAENNGYLNPWGASDAVDTRQISIYATFAVPTLYYVRTDGNDANTGTGPSAAEAWKTVRAATRDSALQAGDIIYVQAGVYTDRIEPKGDGSSGNPIRVIADSTGSISGWSAGDVILSRVSEKVISLDKDDYWVFDGFKIQGNVSKEAIKIKESRGAELIGLEIYGGKQGVVTDEGEVLITNCIIRDSKDEGVKLKDGNDDVTIINCTIAHNGKDGVRQDAGLLDVRNSILAFNGEDGFDSNGGSRTHTYNLVYGNSGAAFSGTSQSTGEWTSDPMFADASARDYTLQSNSPAIDAGVDVTGIVDDDIDGRPRPIGLAWDIGCYESALVGFWKFDDGSGLVATNETSGPDGSLQGGAVFTSARCASAITANGTNAWVDFGAAELGAKAYTVGAWFKTSSSADQTIFAATAQGSNDHLMILSVNNGYVNFVHRFPAASSGGATLLSSVTVADGFWHYVVAVKSSTEMRLYIDGEMTGQISETTAVHSAVDLVAGRLGVNLGQSYFNGDLDEIIVYGDDLSGAEVSSLYGLSARWRLDASSGVTALDSSFYANDASFMGAPVWQPTGGAIGGALQFNGTSDYISAPDNASLRITGDVTISGWFKLANAFNASSSASQILLGKYKDNNNDMLVALVGADYNQSSVADGSLVFKVEANGAYRYAWTTKTVWNAGDWYHFAVVHYPNSPTSNQISIDGVDDTAGTAGSGTGNNLNFSAAFLLGGKDADTSQLSGARYFQGFLDDVQVFARALCADEIANISGSGKPILLRIMKWVEIR